MGIGDDIIATSLAKGARDRGELIAFGDGKTIFWGLHSRMIFKNNPNVALPGEERTKRVRWVQYYKGHRIYNSSSRDRWIWNYGFRVKPGEVFLDESETYEKDDRLILIEPNVPINKKCAPNKQWPLDRWQMVASELTRRGWNVRQFEYGAPNRVCSSIHTNDFRQAIGRLGSARLAILHEGGLHHAAAAVGIPAVVLFGGFVPPQVLGYDDHVNLTGGAEACGSYGKCDHCLEAMRNISAEQVIEVAGRLLGG